ncbi:BsuPI-related putative proteinase inhibitor [Natronorubrum bangense]|uniref:Intracellular proteinase inhibitor BsuPI domain-containing protein n=2 Tax=Natronorubrum bangense TaxID=61858 RepID=A0A4D6HJT0_9EURY|nr:BsuPI-related putative proteinase inhibitor [Natronorubrum bangense]ELY43224.1 hypothetical protein C494_19542 [Natronorubrum bangense JCM 10635]QCC53312.1 hypothetical protein DV706_01740 [Natronorubrum bangense]QCC55994.1 hypothetical protein DV706_15530 [Natronorubrum bangense]
MTLEGRLEADVTTAADGTTLVTFVFTVTNRGPTPVELEFPDACKAEFVVRDDGREVWRFTEGKAFAQLLTSETIPPDETATYEAEWVAPQPGGYVAVAELRAREVTCTAQTSFGV